MIKKYLLLLVIFCWQYSSAIAVDAVECRLDIYQYDNGLQKEILIFDDINTFVKDISGKGFIGPFSIDFNLTNVDSLQVEFNIHLVTLGSSAKTYSRKFTVEYTLPAKISNIKGKKDTQYSLVITPVKKIDIDTAGCSFNHNIQGSFTFNPTGHTDLYYISNSLGDFYWSSVKNLLEVNYRQFQSFCNLTLPGKMQVYLCPCAINSVIWDKRFGMAVDPTRNIAFAIYNKETNTTDPFIVTNLAVLRNFGYAPPFLSDGLANYFSFAIFDMKEILKENRELQLSDFLNSYNYHKADPHIADRVSASFVKFLIDHYTYDRFINLYKAADDLNLIKEIEKTYDKPINDLETEWKEYIDSLQIQPITIASFAEMAESMMNYKLMLKYSLGFLEAASSTLDSERALTLMKRAYFFNGNYDKTIEIQQRLTEFDSHNATNWMALGSYKMMKGYYGKALDDFLKARSLDSSDQMINFNIARYYLYQNDKEKARDILLNNMSSSKGARAQGESRVLLANILKNSDNKAQKDKAAMYYRETISLFSQALQINRSSSTLYLWMGIAYFGLDDKSSALDNLHLAEFLETRPVYSGMCSLWLGKVYEAMGEKEIAHQYYNLVLNLPSADYDRREAKKLLE